MAGSDVEAVRPRLRAAPDAEARRQRPVDGPRFHERAIQKTVKARHMRRVKSEVDNKVVQPKQQEVRAGEQRQLSRRTAENLCNGHANFCGD